MEPFVCQMVHLFAGRARLLAEHVKRLDVASRYLFNRPYRPDLKALEGRLVEEAERSRYLADYSSFVEIELFETGEEICHGVGQSYYAGYAVRSLRPTAVTLRYDWPVVAPSTMATRTAALAATCRARVLGADEALRLDDKGRVWSMGEATLYGIREGFLIVPAEPLTATDTLVRPAADRLRLSVVEHPILERELSLYDELFAVDHRGITSLSRCNNLALMSLRVERLAEAMNQVANAQ